MSVVMTVSRTYVYIIYSFYKKYNIKLLFVTLKNENLWAFQFYALAFNFGYNRSRFQHNFTIK